MPKQPKEQAVNSDKIRDASTPEKTGLPHGLPRLQKAACLLGVRPKPKEYTEEDDYGCF